jgi:hypothetical protein
VCRILIGINATHAGIRTSVRSTLPYDRTSSLNGTLPYPLPTKVERATASVEDLAPVHCRRRVTRPVSCYALFKGWLLLSQPPGCFSNSTSLPTESSLGDLSRWSGLFPSRP